MDGGGKAASYRHELKYVISLREKDLVEERLKEAAYIDPHAEGGSYFIRSLYFDDMWHSAYEDKAGGTLIRKKYRIRIYNLKDDVISLEKKGKRGSYIQKVSVRISREDFFRILKGDVLFLKDRDEALCREFYTEYMSSLLRPEVIVDYRRIPYIYEAGTVRITFDMEVSSAFMSFDIFDDRIPSYGVMPPEMLIMEVKYTEFLPGIFRSLLPPGAGTNEAASKYVMADEFKRRMYGQEVII